MNEINLLHYIQSGEFVDQLLEKQIFDTIYADVGHLYPNCTPLYNFIGTNESVVIILSRLTVQQFVDNYDISGCSRVVIVNVRVGVSSIGHKMTPEFDDIITMVGNAWTVYEPLTYDDLDMIVQTVHTPLYIRITHRYLPSHIDMQSQDGLWFFGDLSLHATYFPASMIESVGGLDPQLQTSQYVLISDWTNWYLSDTFREVAQGGGTTVLCMEQSPGATQEYVDIIQSVYPKHRIVARSVGTLESDKYVLIDEYRDEFYGSDVSALQKTITPSQ